MPLSHPLQSRGHLCRPPYLRARQRYLGDILEDPRLSIAVFVRPQGRRQIFLDRAPHPAQETGQPRLDCAGAHALVPQLQLLAVPAEDGHGGLVRVALEDELGDGVEEFGKVADNLKKNIF